MLVPAKLVIGRGWVLSDGVAVAPPWNLGERIATTRNGKKSNSIRLEDLESLGSPQRPPFFLFIDTRLARISFLRSFLIVLVNSPLSLPQLAAPVDSACVAVLAQL